MSIDNFERTLRKSRNKLVYLFRRIFSARRYTIMFIPHSEKRIFNFQVSRSIFVFMAFLLGILIMGFVYTSTTFFTIRRQELDKIIIAQAQLDQIERDIEQEQKKLASLLEQKKQLEMIIESDEAQVDSILKYHTQFIKNLLNQNNFMGIVYGILESFIAGIFIYWFTIIRKKEKNS